MVDYRNLVVIGEFVDVSGGLVACGMNKSDICSYSITNNIVAGTWYADYVVYGQECGSYPTQTVFRNNIGHSS
jgi:hypothetical protein